MRRPGERGDHGFTLVETAVALVILTSVLAALYQIYQGGWRGVRAAARYEEALSIARAELAAAGIVTFLAAGAESGIQGPYRWRRQIRPHAGGPAGRQAAPLFWVTAEVTWQPPGHGNPVTLSLTTLKKGRPR